MSLYDKYQARVGRAQGGTRQFITAEGYFNLGDVRGGADGSDISGAVLQYALLSPVTRTSFTMASAIQTVSIIPIKYGLVTMIYPSATTSIKLPSAEPGATLLLNLSGVATNLSILAGNASVVAGAGKVSCIYTTSVASVAAWVELRCFTQGEWAVARISSPTSIALQAE